MSDRFTWWNDLRHGGLLLDAPRLSALVPTDPEPLSGFDQDRLRRRLTRFQDEPADHRGELISFVLEAICGFARPLGEWYRGSEVKTDWSRKAITGESMRPRHLWIGKNGATLPVFVDDQQRIGVCRGRRVISHVLQWLRQGDQQLALVTNGHQWRLVFAGLDYEAFCEWDINQWLAEGEPSRELTGLRALFAPALWTPSDEEQPCPLLAAINNSRKGQADLSQILGERVRQAAEHLIQSHTSALKDHIDTLPPQEIYRAAVRMIMRLVVVLFAESREGLLARDNPIFHTAYSLQGLREQLERISEHRLVGSVGAWPRVLALLRMIFQGSSHPDLPVPAYGGELFAPGRPDDPDAMKRALHLFESACFSGDDMNDFQVRRILDLLTRTKVKIRQGRTSMLMPAPVDFSSLDSEYIGILYEGLLDFELRSAVEDEPIIFLAVGNQPALPLSTLERMDDRAIKNLLEKLKDTSSGDDEEESGDEEEAESDDANESGDADNDEGEEADEEFTDEESTEAVAEDDPRFTLKSRAETWARRACQVGNLIRKPTGKKTPEKQMRYEQALDRKARQLVVKVVLPGEWYLVRWGGTRKGSGTFYTLPQLAVPTVHRTLHPLAYDPPVGEDKQPNRDAPAEQWTPKKPEEILSLKVCDPACGSGSFPLAALRFLTGALYDSLIVHDRVRDHGGRAVLDLIHDEQNREALASEPLPCRPDDDEFELRTKAILRRYVVERCIYGVDINPLAVELCRLSLWIETLDRSLPLTFLNHKIKCGNSLVGAWFDQFLHYPAMAWDREGGDKNHINGIHFEKETWTKALKEFKGQVKSDLIAFIDGGQFKTMYSVDLTAVQTGHDAAEAALKEIHNLGIAQVDQRSTRYDALLASQEFQSLKAAFDLWCALWFWPADQFNAGLHGFDAILGNPPWDVAKPNSKEYFSAIDPLYRSYGKQEASNQHQPAYFTRDTEIERGWLKYNAVFRAQSNWVKYAGRPFGDRVTYDSNGKSKHDFPLGDRGRASFTTSEARHDKWNRKREVSSGYADVEHAFRHQGSGDINLYKMFLEQAHALLREGGRLGMIVPSGVYSDHGTTNLRRLFLQHCSWEWLFSLINWDRIFQSVYYRFKFCISIVQKGGATSSVKCAFGRYHISDWENPRNVLVEYDAKRITSFSPRTLAFAEAREQPDLGVLDTMYSGAVLLADDGPDSWGITYCREFDMTNDSKLFQRRPKWEQQGYRPDEYSRWLKGDWRDRTPDCPAPPGCSRIDISAGIILSRDGSQFICEDDIGDCEFKDKKGKAVTGRAIALPLYEGRMIGRYDFSQKGWESGSGRSAVWREISWEHKQIEPQHLMSDSLYEQLQLAEHLERLARSQGTDAALEESAALQDAYTRATWKNTVRTARVGFMDIGSSTNVRSMIAAVVRYLPCGNVVPVLDLGNNPIGHLSLATILNSLAYDGAVRARLTGLHLNYFVVQETPLLPASDEIVREVLGLSSASIHFASEWFAPEWLRLQKVGRIGELALKRNWALSPHERLRRQLELEAIVAAEFGLDDREFRWIIKDCDYPSSMVTEEAYSRFDPKGFWRVDKAKPPEQRFTILSLIACLDLRQKIGESGGDAYAGILAFCNQNDGEGWMLPETLRLADYGLGHDERAREHQPVRECFGPRFYDWQLAQSPEESWRECHLHARNLLGPEGYQALLDELEGRTPPPPKSSKDSKPKGGQQKLFETESLPLFDNT